MLAWFKAILFLWSTVCLSQWKGPPTYFSLGPPRRLIRPCLNWLHFLSFIYIDFWLESFSVDSGAAVSQLARLQCSLFTADLYERCIFCILWPIGNIYKTNIHS